MNATAELPSPPVPVVPAQPSNLEPSNGRALNVQGSAVQPFRVQGSAPGLRLTAGCAITTELLDQLEAALFELLRRGTPGLCEVDIPVTHTFTQHAYIREGIIPAGLLILGHAHRHVHHCAILSGRMSLLNPDRTWTEVAGPASFVGQPGRKIGFMHTDVLMQNIHPSDGWEIALFEDPEKLEEFLYTRSPAFKRHQQLKALPEAERGHSCPLPAAESHQEGVL